MHSQISIFPDISVTKATFELKIMKKITKIHRITTLPHGFWIEEDECYKNGWNTSFIKI